MTQKELLNIFLQGAGIEADTDDSIAIGYLNPCSAFAGIDAVMQKHTSDIDSLLEQLTEGSIEKLELFIRRGFTYGEYQALFDSTIRENSFRSYPVFRSLWITTEQERRRWTFTRLKDDYDDYIEVLMKALTPFASSLVNFFFGICCYRKGFSKSTSKPTRFSSWEVGGGKIKTFRMYVLRFTKKITEEK